MKTETKFVNISSVTNPENGEVTLFISNESWGPVVTGKNLADAKKKMKEAFGISMIGNSYLDVVKESNEETVKERLNEYKQEMNKLNNTLENAL